MDGREPDRRPEPAGRPLTRRELRAARAAGLEIPEPGDVAAGWPPAEAPRREADSWEAAVGWALRGEGPPVLPPEPPEPDDVRWEPVSGEPVRLPDEPADDRRPWTDSGLWRDDDTAHVPVVSDPPPAPDAAGSPGAAASPEVTAVPEVPRRVSVFGTVEQTAAPAVPGAPAAPPVVDGLPPVPPPGTGVPGELPTLDDLMATRPAPTDGPAEWGWRGAVRRLTGGLVAPRPGPAEQRERASIASVQRPLDGPRTIVVVNPKGGAHKTTATLLLAATFGRLRGGYTLAWDNNETRGTLGWRARHAHHSRTAVDLLEDLERFADPGSARVGDLDAYVRSQTSAQFDVLASDEDAASAASIDGFAFRALHRTLQRFYRVLVVDTGNNMRASNWQAAIEAADQVVVVSTMREDTAQSAAWMLDALRATGHEEVVRNAVTVLSQPAPRIDAELTARLHDHFGRLTRAVLEVPYEPSLVSGGPVDFDALAAPTRRAWLHVTAAVAEGL